MEIDPTTFKAEKDGFQVSIDGKPTKLVLESDLLALKGANEDRSKEWSTKEATFTGQIAEATKASEEYRQKHLQEQANREKLEAQFKETQDILAKVPTLEGEVKTHKEAREKAESELAGLMKSTIVSQYKVDPKKIEPLTLDQLRNTQATLKSLGITPQGPAKYDDGSHGGGGQPETPAERARRILDEHHAKHGNIQVSSEKSNLQK